MPLTLANRIGPDRLGKLEQAARRRYAEARRLITDEPLGAIYLFGYTIEMRLKAAYYHAVGLVPASSLLPARTSAEARIRTLTGATGAVGHNLYGWARLLEDTRATAHGKLPLPTALAKKMYNHVRDVELCWTEVLRYRANRPYNDEIEAVQAGARWFKLNARRLWS
jgi:hypothetical protein